MNARLKTHWPLIVILALNVALSLMFSLVNPLYESTDELHNYRYTRYILATGRLPELDPDQPRIQAHHPPLYYLLGAAATFWIKPDSTWDFEPAWNPYWGFHDWQVGADNKNHYLHGPEEVFPTTGTPLAARVARWVNVVLGVLTVVVTYHTGRRIFTEGDVLPLGAAAIVAFNPQFLYLSGAVNNDVAAGLVGSAIVLACVDQVGRPLTLGRAALMGLLLGLALNTKFNLVFTLAVIELAYVIAAWRERSWKKWLVANLALLAVTLALSGWWFARNQMLYGEPTAIRRTNELWGGRDPRHSWGAALLELPYAWSSLWGRFGYGQIPMPAWIYTAILIVVVMAAVGLVISQTPALATSASAGASVSNRKSQIAKRASLDASHESAYRVLVVLVTVVVFAGMLWGYMLISTAGPMGRFFFPALPALAVCVMLGLSRFVSKRHQIVLSAVISVAMFGLALYSLFGVLAPAYARPALLTPQQVASIPHRLDVTFDGQAKLLGYAVETDTLRPGGQVAVTLYWQALAPMTDNYAVFVHLVNAVGALSAQRDTFPGLGNFPTSQWKPGDTFADTYHVDVGDTAYAPDEAVVQVGLYLPGGPRLVAFKADGQPLGDAVSLAPAKLAPRAGAYPNAVRVNFDNKLALLGYDMNARSVRPGETISVTLYWQSLAPMQLDYSVFMHLTSTRGEIPVKNDSFPYTSPKRTRRWTTGQVMQEVRALTIPEYVLPGLYDIDMGIFSVDTGDRLPIMAPDGHYVSEQMTLLQVRVADK